MKRSKFTEAQIAFILRQAEEGTVIGEVCRMAGISEATPSGRTQDWINLGGKVTGGL